MFNDVIICYMASGLACLQALVQRIPHLSTNHCEGLEAVVGTFLTRVLPDRKRKHILL